MSGVAVNPVYEAIQTRRVTRRMSEQPVDPDLLDLVVGAARWAPNAGNRRLQPIRAVTDTATLRMLKSVSPGMVPTPQAVIVICLDTALPRSSGSSPDTEVCTSTSGPQPPPSCWQPMASVWERAR
jgi:nitroreductase